MTTTDPVLSALWVDPRYLLVVSYRPPAPVKSSGLNLESMQADIDKLITTVAYKFTDQSCVFLHTEDLESEGRCALVNVLNKGWLTRAKNRETFFKILKTAISNRLRSLLQQQRFTQKRTGIKPPDRNERRVNFDSYKPNEISLDDPEAHLQVDDSQALERPHSEDAGEHLDAEALKAAISARCSWFERAVLQQLSEPDLATLCEAELDSLRGKQPDRVKVVITNVHRALAAGDCYPEMMELFEKAVLQIQSITMSIMEPTTEDANFRKAVDRLAEIFNLQVPPNVKPMVLRRMFTICARDNWTKVTAEVEKLLCIVGAAVPKFNKDSMQCLGVLYQKGHRICESCGVKVSCAAQAANLGLTEVTIPLKLLGAKLNRVPILLPKAERNEPPPTANIRDMEIVSYLCNQNRFRQVTHQGETYYQPVDFTDKQKLLFCVGARSIPFRLRFCNPAPSLRKQLVCVNKSYYVPDKATAAEVIAWIDEHTKVAYARES